MKYSTLLLLPLLTSCATLNDSLQLGASLGAAGGAAATYAAHRSVDGKDPKFENVAAGAAVGLSIGLITSYLVHKNVNESSASETKTEMYFGDLPPSPFVFPNTNKKGAR